ncbi:MAG: BPSS1780 family membrane protein [bacterium]|jgi:uncharacterized membrane protein
MNDQVQTTSPDAAFNREGNARPAGAGLDWWTKAWPLFTRQVGMWIGVFVAIFLVMAVASFIPVIGQLAIFLFGPVVAGGLMLGAREVDRGGELTFGHIVAGFSNQMGQLVLIGLIYLAGMIVAGLIVALVGGIGVGTMLGAAGGEPAAMGAAGVSGLLLAVLIGLALMLPLYMAMWFAPALVVFHELGAVDAMKASFFGCLKNIVPFLIYGIIGMLLGMIAAIPIFLGWLVLGPVVIASVYVGYRDIYVSA